MSAERETFVFTEIYVDDVLQTLDFTSQSHQFTEVLLEKTTDTYRMIFFGGIAINAKPTSGLLSTSMALTSDWAGVIKGESYSDLVDIILII